MVCEVADVRAATLSLGFLYRAAPGLAPTVPAYRIEPRARRVGWEGAGSRLPVRLEARPEHNLHVVTIGPAEGGGSLGDISISYDLDLVAALASEDGTQGSARVYQDRLVVTGSFATLRGEVLPVPLGYTVRSPRIRVEGPPGWETILNAEKRGEEFVLASSYPADAATRSLRWFGVTGAGLHRESRSVDGVSWTIAVARSQTPPSVVADFIWKRIRHAGSTFGTAPLKHLGLSPPEGIGRQELVLFALPYPDRFERGVGGQYQLGTAFFFYTPGQLFDLGHIVSHEYLHAYNSSALSHAGAGGAGSDDTWFAEGYTDVLATLINLGLMFPDDRVRTRKLRTAVAEAWATTQGFENPRLTGQLLTDWTSVGNALHRDTLFDVSHAVSSAVPMRSSFSPDRLEMWRDEQAYTRSIQGRSTLGIFRLALLMERAEPGGAAFTRWFRILLRDHPAGRDSAVDTASIEEACLEAAGPARAEVSAFLEAYLEARSEVTFEELETWLEDPAFGTVCPAVVTDGPAAL